MGASCGGDEAADPGDTAGTRVITRDEAGAETDSEAGGETETEAGGTTVPVTAAQEQDAEPPSEADMEAWCVENRNDVWDLAEELALIGPVGAYYDLQGGGLDDFGEPIDNPENRELSDEMRRRNVEDNANFLRDLHTNYLEHEAGQLACTLAFAESA